MSGVERILLYITAFVDATVATAAPPPFVALHPLNLF